MGAGADAGLGRFVAPPGRGPGWAKLADAVRALVPPAEIETIYLFRPFRRDGREWGTAVVTRRATGERLAVYTARYMLVLRGKERGRSETEVREVALSPQAVIEQVMREAAERLGDEEPPVAAGRSVWYEG